jgi:death-on-curing protein
MTWSSVSRPSVAHSRSGRRTKAAVLCARIAKTHPLPDGNKRTAFLSMLEFLDANGIALHRTATDPEETVAMIEGVAAGTVDEDTLADWIRERAA